MKVLLPSKETEPLAFCWLHLSISACTFPADHGCLCGLTREEKAGQRTLCGLNQAALSFGTAFPGPTAVHSEMFLAFTTVTEMDSDDSFLKRGLVKRHLSEAMMYFRRFLRILI